jgi:adenylylsulfate kinase-like enzyme
VHDFDDPAGYARKYKKLIADKLTNKEVYTPENRPVSVFMAGSPGAGKTEASIELLNQFPDAPIVRIDPDAIRENLPGYQGSNAADFQEAVSIIVSKALDKVLENSQSFLLDGTLSSYHQAHRNIERSLKKDRFVQILYVYQSPEIAWRFVERRRQVEGRAVQLDVFIDQYFAARKVVQDLKKAYGKRVAVDLLMKDIDGGRRWFKKGVETIDEHVPERYTPGSLRELLTKRGE